MCACKYTSTIIPSSIHVLITIHKSNKVAVMVFTTINSGADPGFVEGGGGRSGYRELRRREGFWRVPFEDPLWNFKRGGARPLCPPPLNPLVKQIGKKFTAFHLEI